jgi:hypothetical protein
MNTGILFGEVTSSTGPVADASVTIDWLKGDLAMPAIRVQLTEKDNDNAWVRADTNSDGKYVIPFFWDGTQIASAISTSVLTMRTFATTSNDADRKRVNAHLSLDLKKLFSNIFPTFDNPTQEAFDCAKDFMLAYRSIKAFPPHHKIILSTEVWGILARANFFVLPPPKKESSWW